VPLLALRLAFSVPLLKSLHSEREPPGSHHSPIAPGLAPGANQRRAARGSTGLLEKSFQHLRDDFLLGAGQLAQAFGELRELRGRAGS